MMPTLPSLVAQQVVIIMTTCGATSDDKVGIMMTPFSVIPSFFAATSYLSSYPGYFQRPTENQRGSQKYPG